jgi:hypothetical protein
MIFGGIAGLFEEFLEAILTEAKQSFQKFADSLWIPWSINWFDPFSVLAAVASAIPGVLGSLLTLMEELILTIPLAWFELLRVRVSKNIPKDWGTSVMTRKAAFLLTLDVLLDDGPRSVINITGNPIWTSFVLRLKKLVGKVNFFRGLSADNLLYRLVASRAGAWRYTFINRLLAILFAGFRFWGLFVLAFVAVVFLEKVSRDGYGAVFQQKTPRVRVRVKNKAVNDGRASIRRRLPGGNIP